MRLLHWFTLLGLIAVTQTATAKGHENSTDIQVMVVADFHMSNPGQDQINFHSDDVLTPKRQEELDRVAKALARFRPTKVGVEWDRDYAQEQWHRYRAGSLNTSRNEVVQLGFRLARMAQAEPIGFDVPGEFPFEAVASFASANGMGDVISSGMKAAQDSVEVEQKLLLERGVPALLRHINDPSYIANNHSIYMSTLRVGRGNDQPGVELMTAWYRRNANICAHLLQAANPGDRVVLFFGGNHAYLLRQCAKEAPGVRLVDPLKYLPR